MFNKTNVSNSWSETSASSKIEDSVKTLLRKFKTLGLFTEELYKKLYVSGSGPGVLYRLPKIHKPNFCTNYHFRPIFAAYNAPTFNIAKFLVPILSPLTVNSHTVSNSYSFVKDIAGISDASNCCMVSYDTESLFTIPLSETIEISLNKLFVDATTTVIGLSRNCLKIFCNAQF